MLKRIAIGFVIMFSTLFRSCDVVYATTIQSYLNYVDGSTVNYLNLEGNFQNIRNVVNGDLDNNNAATYRGFRFYEVLGVLPLAGTRGRIVYLTTTNLLYFDTGSQFLSFISVPTDSADAGDILYYKAGNWITSQGAHAQGDLLYYDGADWLQLPTNSISTNYLSNRGTNNNPSWSKIQMMDGLFMPNQAIGDLFYASTSSVVNRLAAGTSGKFLKTLGPGVAPVWSNGSLQLISTTTISATTNTGDISIEAGKSYLIDISGVVSNFNDDTPQLLFNNDTAGNYKDNANTSRNNVGLTNAAGTQIIGGGGEISTKIIISCPNGAQIKAAVQGSAFIFFDSTGAYKSYAPSGVFLGATPTSFRITNNRNFASLTVRVYEFGQ